MTAARAALTAAFAAHTEAQRHNRDAKRALARLQPPNFAGKQEIDWLKMSDQEFATYSAAEEEGKSDRGCPEAS